MHFHILHLHYTLNRELAELYASIALRNFTVGLVGIFEPIYLFLFFSNDLVKTLLFFAAINLLHSLLTPLSGKIIVKLGVKHAMLASVPFIFLYYLGLWQVENLGNFFLVLIPLAVMYNLFYWTAFHIDFARFSESKNRGSQLSYRHTIAALSAAASPLAGGILIALFGYPALFAIVLVLLFASAVPLFLSEEAHEVYTDSFQKAFQEVFLKKYRSKVVAFLAEGGESIGQTILWPIFLFILAISYSSIGAIFSVALLAGVIFALYMGRKIDKMGSARMLVLGSWLNAFTWPIKMFVSVPIDAFLINTLHHFTRLTSLLPFSALFYDWSAREGINRDRFIILREMCVNCGKAVMLFVLAGFFLFTNDIAFVFPAFGLLSLFFIFFTRGQKNGA